MNCSGKSYLTTANWSSEMRRVAIAVSLPSFSGKVPMFFNLVPLECQERKFFFSLSLSLKIFPYWENISPRISVCSAIINICLGVLREGA